MKTKLATFLTAFTISLVGISGGLAHAAGSGTLGLSPSSGTENNGTTFTTSVYENGNGTSVNVVTANLSYSPTQLQYVSSSCGGAFSASAGNSGGNGSVSLNCYIPGGTAAPTDNELVGSVTFTVLAGSGSANVSFGSGSIMATPSTSPSTNIWNGATTGASFTLATPSTSTGGTGTTATGSGSTSTGSTTSGSSTTGSSTTGSGKSSTSGSTTSGGKSTGSTTGSSTTSSGTSGSTPTSTSSTGSSSNKSSSTSNKHNQRGRTIHGRLVSSTGSNAAAYWTIGIVVVVLIAAGLIFRKKLLSTVKTVTTKYKLGHKNA